MGTKGSIGLGGTRGFGRAAEDFYPTPRALSIPLIRRDGHKWGMVWEPACGEGDICKELGAIPYVASDLVDRGFGVGGVDFLQSNHIPHPIGCGTRANALITNPPFKLWRDFAEKATSFLRPEDCRESTLSPQSSGRMGLTYVALVGRLQLLEGRKASSLFRRTNLTRVMVSAGRVNMPPRGPWFEDKGHTGMIAWAWYVWEAGHIGAPPDRMVQSP